MKKLKFGESYIASETRVYVAGSYYWLWGRKAGDKWWRVVNKLI